MFVYRYVYIIIFVIVYNFGFELDSSAIETTTKKNIVLERKYTLINESENKFIQSNIVLAEASDVEHSERINKNLYLAGIVLTSIVFLYVLFLLFKPEKQQNVRKVKTDLVKYEPIVSIENETISLAKTNNITVISDKKTALPESKDRQSIAQKETSEPVFSMIGMEQDEELDYKSIPNLETVEIQNAKLIRPETTVAEISSKLANDSEPQVESDLMGKLTIIKSKTTEIDFVYELIQDLQNNRTANSARAKDIRRKAIWELGQTKDYRAVEHLIQIMPDVDSLEKSLILDSITKITNRSLETVNNVLLTSLENESVEVRKNAIKDLIYLYQSFSSVAVHLSKMTEDSNIEVRNTAKWALKKFDKISYSMASID